jgi:signal transduction histidine kinase
VFPSVVLLFATSIFLWDVYNSNIYLFLIQYLIIFILGYFTKININNVFLICKVMFGIIISIFFPNDILNVKLLGYAFLVWIIMYLVFYAIIKFYDKVSKVVELYSSLEEITKEKKLYESLFKITHEIKNPLAVCKGYLDMFDVNNPAKASRYAGIIDQEIDRTLLLLKDFSNVSKLNIDKEKMEVGMLLDDVCDEAELILDNNIKFISDIKDDDVYIEADYNRIKQAAIGRLLNLEHK